jgi:hypothetical protein
MPSGMMLFGKEFCSASSLPSKSKTLYSVGALVVAVVGVSWILSEETRGIYCIARA